MIRWPVSRPSHPHLFMIQAFFYLSPRFMPDNFLSTLPPAEPLLPCDLPWRDCVFSVLIKPFLSKCIPFTTFLVPAVPQLTWNTLHSVPSLPFLKVYAPFPRVTPFFQVKSLQPGTSLFDSIRLFPWGTISIRMLKRIPFCPGPQQFLIKQWRYMGSACIF